MIAAIQLFQSLPGVCICKIVVYNSKNLANRRKSILPKGRGREKDAVAFCRPICKFSLWNFCGVK